MEMLALRPTVVRGNASEIMALSGAEGNVRGVDSTAASIEALRHAALLARAHGCTVAVSGEVDYITDGCRVLEVRNGVEMLTLVTAAGCALTALVAAFVSQHREDPVAATAAAMAGCWLPRLRCVTHPSKGRAA
jgi:hydroxyethylthiazole kinase